MMSNLLDPEYKTAVSCMNARLTDYWRCNVKRYFSLTEKNYTELHGKYRHWIAFRDNNNTRLVNAIEIIDSSGVVRIGVKEILVPMRNQTTWKDLIIFLQHGTPRSPGAYIRWSKNSDYKYGGYGDIRRRWETSTNHPTDEMNYHKTGTIPKSMGTRGGTTGQAWTNWWNDFMQQVDKELNILADLSADILVNKVVKTLEDEF